jgi:putative transposase
MAYCLAWAAQRTGVLIHAVCVMSNHYHVVVTDPHGKLPEFMHALNLYSAKCLNAAHGRWENLWATEQPSAVCLQGEEDILDKIAYCLANPVSAGLVAEGRTWPGLRSQPSDVVGGEQVVERPEVFFRKDGLMPEKITLRFERPAVWDGLDDDALAHLIDSAVEGKEQAARDQMREEGRHFAGVRKVLAQRPGDSPGTTAPRRQKRPLFAARNKEVRAAATEQLKSFWGKYREAYEQFSRGMRNVVFPPGTYAMSQRHGVLVANTC